MTPVHGSCRWAIFSPLCPGKAPACYDPGLLMALCPGPELSALHMVDSWYTFDNKCTCVTILFVDHSKYVFFFPHLLALKQVSH